MVLVLVRDVHQRSIDLDDRPAATLSPRSVRRLYRVPAGVLPKHQRLPPHSDVLGLHDHVGAPILQDAVLMDADSCTKALRPTIALL
jgi:hypothetical protein